MSNKEIIKQLENKIINLNIIIEKSQSDFKLLQKKINQLQNQSPYQCYWSHRALAAENKLKKYENQKSQKE